VAVIGLCGLIWANGLASKVQAQAIDSLNAVTVAD
jgi:hypothetical protein